VTRAPLSENLPGLRTPDDQRVRFLSPALIGRPVLQNPWRAIPKGRTKYPQSKMKEVLLSGCTANEYSYDALIGGTYHGAMTYHALEAIGPQITPLPTRSFTRGFVTFSTAPATPSLRSLREARQPLPLPTLMVYPKGPGAWLRSDHGRGDLRVPPLECHGEAETQDRFFSDFSP
jgi:hypothetical protein